MENQETPAAASAPAANPAPPPASMATEPMVARKPCPSCGEMIAETAKKCRFCGEVLDQSIAPVGGAGTGAVIPPSSAGVASTMDGAKPLLYNPNVAGILSLFFTTVFGSWCLMRNYEALGASANANRSKIWIIISVIIYLLLGTVIPMGVGLVFVIVWYFCENRKQNIYLQENNIAYEKKGWLIPVLVAIGANTALFIVLVLLSKALAS